MRFASGFALAVLVSRNVTQDDFGRLTFAMTIATFLGVATDFGLPSLAVRDVAQDPKRAQRYYRSGVTLKALFSFVGFAAIVAFMHIAGYPPETRRVVYPITAFTFITSIGSYHYFLFRGLERMDLDTLASFIHNALMIVCVGGALLLALRLQPVPIKYVTTGYLAAGIISTGLIMFVLGGRIGGMRLAFEPSFWKELLGRSSYFAFYGFLGLIYMQIDTVMLSLSKSLPNAEQEIALYQAPLKFLNAAAMVLGVVIHVFTPMLARRFIGPREEFKGLVYTLNRIGTTLITPMMAFSFVFSAPIIAFLFKPEYAGSAVILQVLSLGFLAWFGPPYSVVFVAMNRQKINFIVSAICAIVNTVLNLIFIPRYGALAAASTTLFTYILMKGCYIYYMRHHLGGTFIDYRYLTTILLCAVLAVAVKFTGLHVIPAGILFTAVYGACCYLFVLSKAERLLCMRLMGAAPRDEAPAKL